LNIAIRPTRKFLVHQDGAPGQRSEQGIEVRRRGGVTAAIVRRVVVREIPHRQQQRGRAANYGCPAHPCRGPSHDFSPGGDRQPEHEDAWDHEDRRVHNPVVHREPDDDAYDGEQEQTFREPAPEQPDGASRGQHHPGDRQFGRHHMLEQRGKTIAQDGLPVECEQAIAELPAEHHVQQLSRCHGPRLEVGTGLM
jgi:hypothetical protein